MAASPRFPSPPGDYTREWGNQYTRLLEQQLGSLFTSIQSLEQRGQPTSLTFYGEDLNFNSANTDNQIDIVLPDGYGRYLVTAVRISGASGTLTTATAGLFTAAGGGGTAIVTGASAITVNTASEGTNNNSQSMTVNNTGTQSYTNTELYFRIANPQGSAATGDVAITVQLLL